MVKLRLFFADSFLDQLELVVDLVHWKGLGWFKWFLWLFEATFDCGNLTAESLLLWLNPVFKGNKLILQDLGRSVFKKFPDTSVDSGKLIGKVAVVGGWLEFKDFLVISLESVKFCVELRSEDFNVGLFFFLGFGFLVGNGGWGLLFGGLLLLFDGFGLGWRLGFGFFVHCLLLLRGCFLLLFVVLCLSRSGCVFFLFLLGFLFSHRKFLCSNYKLRFMAICVIF